MLYIHHTSSISPQSTFAEIDLARLHLSSENKLTALEPAYEGIPNNVLRRMGKAVRLSVGSALPLLKNKTVDGIIIGTANGGMEDSVKFMNQIVQYEEGMLTPGNFVQSTPNGLAAQIGLSQKNRNYNITHVHKGLAFENALLDAGMLLRQYPEKHYLVGAADEISSYNYNVDYLAGWCKKEIVTNKELYALDSPGSIAGEGAAMFIVQAKKEKALARLSALHTLHSKNPEEVTEALHLFLNQIPASEKPELLVSGENGDNRLLRFYAAVESQLPEINSVLRFKHMCGEYPTASSFALWLSCVLLNGQSIPSHALKNQASVKTPQHLLIYNCYQEIQHSFMLVSSAT